VRACIATVCAAAVLAAAGCGGSLFQSKVPPPTVYLLSAESGAPGAPLDAALAVLKPLVRSGLNTDRIAAYYPDRHLDHYAGASWSGPLDEVIQDLAVQAFHAGASLANVSADGSAFPDGYWLELAVEDFQAEYAAAGAAPVVSVRLRARLGTAANRRVLGEFEADAHRAAAANRLGAIVAAYNAAANAALAEIVADTTRTIGADGPIRPPQ
jgi:ABC-type uncharacterized transport system auxiliary subunit